MSSNNSTISSSVPGHISSHNTSNSTAQHGTYSFRINEVGGYEADFVSPINRDYECPICQYAFRDPVQTRECGHRFCESCLEPILRYVSVFTFTEICRKFSVIFIQILIHIAELAIWLPTKWLIDWMINSVALAGTSITSLS